MKILVSAGEPSGELYGAELIKHLSQYIGAKYFSIFTGQFENPTVEGIIPDQTSGSSGVVGFSETLKILPRFFANLGKVKRFVKNEKPEVVVLIDYPEFNLRLAKCAKERGSKVIYLAPPQVWAWREWRVRVLRRYVDEVIVFLPFEKNYYRGKGINAHFLGHPLVDLISDLSVATPAVQGDDDPAGAIRVAILPGSRFSEWKNHLEILLEVMGRLLGEFPNMEFILPVPGEDLLLRRLLEDSIESHPEIFEKVQVIRSRRYEAMKTCKIGIVASGTATLEMALLGVPMVVFYRVAPLSALVGRLFIKVPFVSLPNLIFGRRLVPELLQENAKVETIFRFAKLLICSAEMRGLQKKGFEIIRESLGKVGVWQRIAGHLSCTIGAFA